MHFFWIYCTVSKGERCDKVRWEQRVLECFLFRFGRKVYNVYNYLSIGHVILELSSYSQWRLYNTQSILIGCSTLRQEYCKPIGLYYWKLMRRQLWTFICPICSHHLQIYYSKLCQSPPKRIKQSVILQCISCRPSCAKSLWNFNLLLDSTAYV